jgi:hypothetical protein
MKRYLTKTTETYRLNTEAEVETFLKELKSDSSFELSKYTSTKKQVKAKGEVVDEYIKFEVTKIFNDEKEPNALIDVKYDIDSYIGPSDYAPTEED